MHIQTSVFHSFVSYPFFSFLPASDPYTLRFSQSEYRVVENDGALDVTVTVDRPPAFDIPFTVVASVTGNGPDDATCKCTGTTSANVFFVVCCTLIMPYICTVCLTGSKLLFGLLKVYYFYSQGMYLTMFVVNTEKVIVSDELNFKKYPPLCNYCSFNFETFIYH